MRFIMKFLVLLWSMFALIILAPHAGAQSLPQYVKQTPPPDWVVIQEVPLSETELKPEGSQFYRLVDWQQRINGTVNDRYRHNAIELKTADAVQDNSNFKISFDPSYQTVRIHSLNLIRAGKVLNRLKLTDFDIYRLETDREKLLYNGTLETALIIPDVQVGDILDYSYTVSGKNSALGPHYQTSTQLKYSVPIQRQHERILIHEKVPVHIQRHQNPIAPKQEKEGNYRIYSWSQNDLEKIEIDDNLPAWYYPRPTYEFSSFATWEDVGEYFADKYKFNYTKGAPISDVADSIKLKSNDVKTRIRLALDYVHDNIRYTGIEIGSGGYIPRPPEKTLDQKFGDCKDMTVLLLAILREMDIEANPILVDADYRSGIDRMIPSHRAFDHVLVHTVVAGETFLLDGTRGKQLGDLDRMEQGSYGKGLLLENKKPRLIDLALKQPSYYKDVQDTFEMLSDPNSISLESISNYYGYEADNMYSTFLNDGPETIRKSFFEFFQSTYPDIEQIGGIEINAFPESGKFSVKAKYNLGKGWVEDKEEAIKSFEAYPSDVTNDIPDFKGGTRKMPYALSHPRKSRHQIIFKLDESWPLENDEVKVENSAFKFRKTSTFENGVYKQSYIYQSKQGHIAADIFTEAMADIKGVEDELGVELTNGTDWLSNLSEEAFTMFYSLWIAFAVIISFIGAIVRNKVDAEWQQNQLFYPVKLSKFILLSAVSIGVYCYFWAYKNWKWINNIKGYANIPFVRSLFMVFTNFVFLPRLSGEEDQEAGYSWYGSAMGVFLALSYLVLEVIGSVPDIDDDAPVWLSMLGALSFVVLIPAAMQINKLNAGRKEIIEQNSTYHWTTIAFVLLFAPVFLLILFAIFA